MKKIADSIFRNLLGIDRTTSQHIDNNNYFTKYLSPLGISFTSYYNYTIDSANNPHLKYNQYNLIAILYLLMAQLHDDLAIWCYNNYNYPYRIPQAEYWYRLAIQNTGSSGELYYPIHDFFIINKTIEEVLIKKPMNKWKHIGNYPPGNISQSVNTNDFKIVIDRQYRMRNDSTSSWSSWISEHIEIYWDNNTNEWKYRIGN